MKSRPAGRPRDAARRSNAEEDDARRATHWGVLPREFELVYGDFVCGDAVASLIADVQEISRRIDVEASRIVAPGPFVSGMRQLPCPAVHGEDAKAVVQPVSCVDESPIP